MRCMKQRKLLGLFAAIIIGICAMTSCTGKGMNPPASADTTVYIPQAPDYADTTMWITMDMDTECTGADIFYVVSTWEKDWTTDDGHLCHYADVWNPGHRQRMATEINRIASYMAPGNRFYAPYYRHTTIDAWVTQNEDTIQQRTRLAMADVCDAFDRFQAQRDTLRPFIIAGFSQGGMAVVELLKHMSDATYSQMAAAYVLGYKVTDDDFEKDVNTLSGLYTDGYLNIKREDIKAPASVKLLTPSSPETN